MAIEGDRRNFNQETLANIKIALTELSLTLPPVPQLELDEQIIISTLNYTQAREYIEHVIKLLEKLDPQDSDAGLSIIEANSEGKRLRSSEICELERIGIHTCEELSKLGIFDLKRLGVREGHIGHFKDFLQDRGYNYPGCELNNYDKSQFEKASVTPGNLLPLYEKNVAMKLHNEVFGRLIRCGINTYGKLTSCRREELYELSNMGEGKVKYIENFIENLGLKLKLKQ